jgi:hypothetical protein
LETDFNHKEDYRRYEMDTEETKDKGDRANSTDFGFTTMGQGMFEMMNKCCTGQGGFPDCSMMKSMIHATKNQPCCTSKKEDIPPKNRK